jgi:8-oxo-dGTP diphosphatase
MRRRGVIAVVMRDTRFLVIRRSAHVAAPRLLCFPGGGIEVGETEAEALVREFREELGAEIRPGRRVWTNTTRWNTELAWWTAELDEKADLTPNLSEVAAIHWLAPDEILAHRQLLESNRRFLEAIAAGELTLESPH